MTMPGRLEVPAHLSLQRQEIPFNDPNSRFMFTKNFVATRSAFRLFGPEVLFACLLRIQARAQEHDGLDYLQIFKNLEKIRHDGKDLWFIEDGAVVTALLPEDY